jgi:hypothetical protein
MNVKAALCAIFVVIGAAFLVEAKYDISSYTIDNGGAVSTGGTYIVRGTIGQHDAAYSEGDSYELLGGFWPGEPSCVVDFKHFARFAQYWLYIEDCSADLYDDDIIDWLDVDEFVYEWLYYCPYDWPLK